ncbi:MAG: hypothetical protein JWQ27_3222 [Ferruginibacter sp.]|nr:hypothetical protein [Ferruginibacter sp.]
MKINDAINCALLYLCAAARAMKKYFLFFLFLIFSSASLYAQNILPGISVRNISGKIIVSWKNEYTIPVTTINIQRSYDSLKNYTTIGSVLNPQNKENGYPDIDPPYNKMYYRVFIAFEGGAYIISQPVRPVKNIPGAGDENQSATMPWQLNPMADSNLIMPPANGINLPSRRIYNAKDNSIVIHLPDASLKKYSVKFFELENMVLELTKLHEEFLILEKVNFAHSGWYRFELYESGLLVEKNKIFVPRDGKNFMPDVKKPGLK